MLLIKSKSDKAIGKNIKREEKSGKAYEERKKMSKKKGGKKDDKEGNCKK